MLTQIVAKLKVFHLFWNQLLSAREKVVNEDLYRTQTWDIKKKQPRNTKTFKLWNDVFMVEKEKDSQVTHQINKRLQSLALERIFQAREGCNHCVFRVMSEEKTTFQRNVPGVFLAQPHKFIKVLKCFGLDEQLHHFKESLKFSGCFPLPFLLARGSSHINLLLTSIWDYLTYYYLELNMVSNNIHTVQNTTAYVSQVSGCREHTELVLKSPNSSAVYMSALLTEVLVLIFSALMGQIQINVIE